MRIMFSNVASPHHSAQFGLQFRHSHLSCRLSPVLGFERYADSHCHRNFWKPAVNRRWSPRGISISFCPGLATPYSLSILLSSIWIIPIYQTNHTKHTLIRSSLRCTTCLLQDLRPKILVAVLRPASNPHLTATIYTTYQISINQTRRS